MAVDGLITFSKKNYGMDFKIEVNLSKVFDPLTIQHLKLAKEGSLMIKFLGRYDTAACELNACNYLLHELKGNTTAINKIITRKDKVIQEQDHKKDIIVNVYYPSFKTAVLKQASQLSCKEHTQLKPYLNLESKIVERLTSCRHTKPTKTNMPTLFVPPVSTKGDFKSRCHDMKYLTLKEQSAQIMFISQIYKVSHYIDWLDVDLAENQKDGKFLQLKKKFDVWKEIGSRWEEKWGTRKTIYNILVNLVGKKRKYS